MQTDWNDHFFSMLKNLSIPTYTVVIWCPNISKMDYVIPSILTQSKFNIFIFHGIWEQEDPSECPTMSPGEDPQECPTMTPDTALGNIWCDLMNHDGRIQL